VIFESDYELPGQIPGVLRNLSKLFDEATIAVPA
jgi:hypothetical protein